jgi:hypothetical protein
VTKGEQCGLTPPWFLFSEKASPLRLQMGPAVVAGFAIARALHMSVFKCVGRLTHQTMPPMMSSFVRDCPPMIVDDFDKDRISGFITVRSDRRPRVT